MKNKKERPKLKAKVMNPPSEERKKEIIRNLSKFIQDTYYSQRGIVFKINRNLLIAITIR